MSEPKELAREALERDARLESAILELQYALSEREQQEKMSARVEAACQRLAGACIENEYNVDTLARALLEAEAERERLREATESLLELLTSEAYYWHADDPELEAVNRIRRILGWREVSEEHLEVERQVREAEERSES